MKVKLGDVCEINMGQSPASTTYNEEKIGIPFFQGNVDFGEIFPTVRIWCSEPKKISHYGDILISVRAPIGALNFSNCDCCIGRGLAALTVDKEVCLQKYLWYVLINKIEELNSKGTGSTFKAINKSILSETEFNLPDLVEQRHIAAVLDKVSDLIALRKKQLAKLDELVKARFVEMFGDCKINPKKWRICNLEDIAQVGSSKRVFVEELKKTGIPFYRGTEVGMLAEGKDIIPELFITQEHYEELSQACGKPKIGDLLMPSICPDGRIWIVDSVEPFYFKDGRVLWVHDIDKRFNPVFLLHTLKERIMIDYNSIASGTTFSEIKIFSLKKCKVFDVCIEIQNRFADFAEQVDKQKMIVKQSLEKLETLKKSLMQEYFG